MNQLPHTITERDETTVSKVNDLIRLWTNQAEFHRLTKSNQSFTRKELFESLNEQLLILNK